MLFRYKEKYIISESWFYIWIKECLLIVKTVWNQTTWIHMVGIRFSKRHFLRILFSILLLFFFFANRFFLWTKHVFLWHCKSSFDLSHYEKPYVLWIIFFLLLLYIFILLCKTSCNSQEKYSTCKNLMYRSNNMEKKRFNKKNIQLPNVITKENSDQKTYIKWAKNR